jgi:hypothetical protein
MKINKETLIIAGGYVLFMLIFYFIGVTKAGFVDFLAVAALSGFYCALVFWVKKIIKK